MSKISFEDIGAVVATCQVGANVAGGSVVKLTGNATVGPCTTGDSFCGVIMKPRDGIAAVQFKGFMTVSYTGSLTPGWATLSADGTGGVKPDTEGVAAMVIGVNSDDETAVICL